MKKLLAIYIKKLHFSFSNYIYIPIAGVAMSSPLSPVIVNIYIIIQFESVLVPKLKIISQMETFCG